MDIPGGIDRPEIVTAAEGDVDLLRQLIREYAVALGVDLGYQGFEEEVRDLPGDYVPPRGAAFIALREGEPVGCVAVRPLDGEIAEMKRLFVRPAGRARGDGRALAEAAIDFARGAGYSRVRLDTLPQMDRAQALYRSLGFRVIPPYRFSPVPGTVFMELAL